ncbi:uncharacterized protein LOC134017311 [Osmerus eperlanus]|uniref:uncharacterized protein LOC134017311 n=1 Tax=Osmerus eperlanus TaxID=29151 RepID=UPI002E108D88
MKPRVREMRVQLITTVYVVLLLCICDAFQVFQPASQTLNPDGTFSIICEHTKTGHSKMDARLNKITPPENPSATSEIVCQKENPLLNCTWLLLESNQHKFTVHNVDPNDIGWLYQCEFSNITKIPIITKKGSPTKLLEVATSPCLRNTTKVSECSTPATLHCPDLNLISWLLIGLSALLLLHSLVITSVYVKLKHNQTKRRGGNPESNSTYMDMRKMPAGVRV